MPEDSERQANLKLLKRLYAQGVLDDDEYARQIAVLGGAVGVIGDGASVAGDVVSGAKATIFDQQEQQVDEQINAGRNVIIAGDGARIVVGEEPVATPAVDHDAALASYLRHVISQNRYLRLQGIRSGGKLVSIELEQIYITLRATRQRTVQAEAAWLDAEADSAPGEMRRCRGPAADGGVHTETVTVSVNEALDAERRLVVLGDPGSGKTTLLRYLTLLYARDLAEGDGLVRARLDLDEAAMLPILIPLRRVGAYLKAHPDHGTDGHALLLAHLREMLKAERIELPEGFFDPYLTSGRAVILLDGLDEVADPKLRQRVAGLVDAFVRAYPLVRYVVSSRVVGYTGPARLGEAFATTTVRDFSLEDVRQFLRNWHLAVAVGQMGPGASARVYAESQTAQLLAAIEGSERIRELAINPLMLTVIALVHRDRVKLPDRRAELYAEAVDVLLGKWDEAKNLATMQLFDDRPFDTGDRRLVLQDVALWMHEREQKEIETTDLRRLLGEHFRGAAPDWRTIGKVVDRFLHTIRERTGLLAEHGAGVYRFSHLTFQEYLAALAVAGRDDYVTYTLQHCGDPWWREVILLEASDLSTRGRERATRLIRAIAGCKDEPQPYHNLVLASDCLRDVGAGRVDKALEAEVQQRLKEALETRAPVWSRLLGKTSARVWIEQRSKAMEALVTSGVGYWQPPYGEPEWIEVPAGAFWMGEGGEQHSIDLPGFWIAKVPVTNAQYQLFIKATGHAPPGYWDGDMAPKGRLSHPVVNVTWHDALAYCAWLRRMTGKAITLPSEAEWEKAARGPDKRAYPWGDQWDATKCNTDELGLHSTSPVGIFPEGASPYGCLDMAGNVWEWTRSIYKAYPYNAKDGREEIEAGGSRVLRGGSFGLQRNARCAYRDGVYFDLDFGFRLAVSPLRP